jgi:hypothetical protein
MKTTATKAAYLTQEEFDRELDNSLLIINYPSRNRPYYVCDKTNTETKEKSIIHVYIKK